VISNAAGVIAKDFQNTFRLFATAHQVTRGPGIVAASMRHEAWSGESTLSSINVGLFEFERRVWASASRTRLAAASAAGLLVWCAVAPAQAQDGAVKATFEKFNLFGIFAPDCSRRPNPINNLYYVVRPIDADHVQLDTMATPTRRIEVAVIDRTWRMNAHQIGMLGVDEGRPVAGVWSVDNNGVLQLESVVAGNAIVTAGQFLETGADMPLLNRCSRP
jgi:hypothetical protein